MGRLLEGVNITDDLDVAIDPEDYPDQASPAPPVAGNYHFKVKAVNIRKDKEGNLTLKDGQWPTYVLEQVDVVEPEEAQRTIYLYQDISTKPFQRMNSTKKASTAGDFVRSIDQTRAVSGLLELGDLIEEARDQQATFRARLDWEAYDSAYVKDELAKAGLEGVRFAEMDQKDRDFASGVYKKARLRGMKKFPQLPNGKFNHVWVGPSGESIEAKATITQFYPSNEPVRIKLAA